MWTHETADNRKIVWTSEPCAGCGRAPYRRADGREYLYSYNGGLPVCRPQCRGGSAPVVPDTSDGRWSVGYTEEN